MFERKKLARLWREGHDFCLLARLASEADLLGQSESDSGEATKLFCLAELCEPLMIMYAQNLRLPSSIRQQNIARLPADKFEMDFHRTHGRLLRRMHDWMNIRPQKQLHTLQRVLGIRALAHAEDLSSLGRELACCEVIRLQEMRTRLASTS